VEVAAGAYGAPGGESEFVMTVSRQELVSTFRRLRDGLLAERDTSGCWRGELSPSALSTATAVSALASVDPVAHRDRIAAGLAWLRRTPNADGGWGDTVRSQSNISTSYLVLAAFRLAGADDDPVLNPCRRYVSDEGGLPAVVRRYGTDRTFSAPIVTNLAIAGLCEWSECPPLPFWMAALPRSLFRALGLRVVSYALPALIAIGLAQFVRGLKRGTLGHLARALAIRPALRLLERITPDSGGYLEATPLTSFVAMGLVAAGRRAHRIVARNVAFILGEQTAEGAWRIDRDLAIWLTSLGTRALGGGTEATRDWLLAQQTRGRHRFVDSAPGSWGWTDASGSVPDADDTSGALMALHALPRCERTLPAVRNGLVWLLDLQNADGGWPTFCRGWQKLPFDQSCADITAHALSAFRAWRDDVPQALRARIEASTRHGLGYLTSAQRDDGSWVPLWFGNEHAPNAENPVFGTARVLVGSSGLEEAFDERRIRGSAYLRAAQNADGGWGGCEGAPPSVEETALACEALAGVRGDENAASLTRGLSWLCNATGQSGAIEIEAAPIGLYFASLWYYEKLYPTVFAVSALRTVLASSPGDSPGREREEHEYEHVSAR
jgi:squalene-hopene/tetraprenyl-beta-curcumene cyclase